MTRVSSRHINFAVRLHKQTIPQINRYTVNGGSDTGKTAKLAQHFSVNESMRTNDGRKVGKGTLRGEMDRKRAKCPHSF